MLSRITRFSFLLFLSLFSTAYAATETELKNKDLEQLKQSALADDFAYFTAESLTTEFGARLSGSQAELNSIDWLESKMQDIGLKNIRKQEVKVRNWRRHNAAIQINSPYKHQLVTVSLGGSVPTPEQGITAETVRFSSIEELRSAKPEQVQDKIVYIAKSLKPDSTSAEYLSAVTARQQGAIVASQLGAKAIIVRSLTTLSSRIAHTGAVLYEPDTAKIPAASVSAADADLLDRLFAKNLAVNLTLTLNNSETQWDSSFNLSGEIIGSEKPEEIVLLIAHIDSWDLGTGALDNAAGVGIMLATMRQLAQLPQQPKRSIRVLFVTNSQFKQNGMLSYIQQHRTELDNIVVATESDLGADFIKRLDTAVNPNALAEVDDIHTLVSDLHITRGHNDSAGSTNSKYLLKYQVPVFNWIQDSTDYFKFLHSANDTFDKIKLESLQQNVAVYSLFAYSVANSSINFKLSDK